jgi:L-ascorbate metabolism protein UlaG (beta-lactamase superfamily)
MKLNSAQMLLLAGSVALAACGQASDQAAVPADAATDPAPTAETAAGDTGRGTGDVVPTESGDLVIEPIAHATFGMEWNGLTIYVDPTGGAEAFEGLAGPDLVLITDVHGDHMDAETLQAVVTPETEIVAPAAVVEELPEALAAQARTLANGEETMLLGLNVEAIPMYNLTEERLQYHEEGRGNGYVVTMGGTRVYIAGDTEDIPEMRQLEDIDVAFVPFNLPFTMTAEQAADAVLAFEPDIVYPYHYRGSDVDEFARLVTDGNPDIEVRRGEWY